MGVFFPVFFSVEGGTWEGEESKRYFLDYKFGFYKYTLGFRTCVEYSCRLTGSEKKKKKHMKMPPVAAGRLPRKGGVGAQNSLGRLLAASLLRRTVAVMSHRYC